MKHLSFISISAHYVLCFITLLFFSLISCKENKPTISDAEHTYNIELKELINSKNLLSDDMFEITDIVCLETNDSILVADIAKCDFFDDKIYIEDSKGQFFIFNKDGRIIKRIYDIGRGPGQYSQISSFALYKNNLSFYDSAQDRFTTYDTNGELLSQRKIDIPFDDFKYCNDSIILLACSSTNTPGMLCVYNINSDKIVNNFFEHDEDLYWARSQNFNRYKDACYFKSNYGQTLYEVKIDDEGECKVYPKYYIDFNKGNFDKVKMVEVKLPDANIAILVHAPYMALINFFYETDLFFYMNVISQDINEDIGIDIYISKSTEKAYYNMNADENDTNYLRPLCIDSENNFVTTLDPGSISNLNRDRLSLNIKEKIKKLRDSDNPIIVKYKLKNLN